MRAKKGARIELHVTQSQSEWNYGKTGQMRTCFKACRKGCENSTDITQLKVNGIIQKNWTNERRVLKCMPKRAREQH